MGYRCTWIALRGDDGDAVLDELGLTRTGQAEEPVYDTGLYGVALAGWYLAIGDGSEHMGQLEEPQAAALSRDGEALFFTTEDSAMATRLCCYQQGRAAWSITYAGSDGIVDPQIEGAVPRLVSEIYARLSAAQAADGEADHLYELTTEVGRALIGFRHDQTLSSADHPPIDLLSPAD